MRHLRSSLRGSGYTFLTAVGLLAAILSDSVLGSAGVGLLNDREAAIAVGGVCADTGGANCKQNTHVCKSTANCWATGYTCIAVSGGTACAKFVTGTYSTNPCNQSSPGVECCAICNGYCRPQYTGTPNKSGACVFETGEACQAYSFCGELACNTNKCQ